jgi:hypothetical protein
MKSVPLGLLVACCAAPLAAQTLKSIEIASDRVGTDEPVALRIEFEPYTGTVACAFHINYGDGEEADVPVEKLPVVLERRYAQAATYVMSVKGKMRMRGILNIKPACDGPLLTRTVTVVDRAVEEEEKSRKEALEKHEAKLKEDKEALDKHEAKLKDEQERLRRERRELEAAAAQLRASEAAARAAPKPPAQAASAKGVTRPK